MCGRLAGARSREVGHGYIIGRAIVTFIANNILCYIMRLKAFKRDNLDIRINKLSVIELSSKGVSLREFIIIMK